MTIARKSKRLETIPEGQKLRGSELEQANPRTKLRIAPGKQTQTVKLCFRTRGSVNQNENISYLLVGGQFLLRF